MPTAPVRPRSRLIRRSSWRRRSRRTGRRSLSRGAHSRSLVVMNANGTGSHPDHDRGRQRLLPGLAADRSEPVARLFRRARQSGAHLLVEPQARRGDVDRRHRSRRRHRDALGHIRHPGRAELALRPTPPPVRRRTRSLLRRTARRRRRPGLPRSFQASGRPRRHVWRHRQGHRGQGQRHGGRLGTAELRLVWLVAASTRRGCASRAVPSRSQSKPLGRSETKPAPPACRDRPADGSRGDAGRPSRVSGQQREDRFLAPQRHSVPGPGDGRPSRTAGPSRGSPTTPPPTRATSSPPGRLTARGSLSSARINRRGKRRVRLRKRERRRHRGHEACEHRLQCARSSLVA